MTKFIINKGRSGSREVEATRYFTTSDGKFIDFVTEATREGSMGIPEVGDVQQVLRIRVDEVRTIDVVAE